MAAHHKKARNLPLDTSKTGNGSVDGIALLAREGTTLPPSGMLLAEGQVGHLQNVCGL